LFRTADEDPITLVSEILRRSGVKIGKINMKKHQIMGKIGSLFDPEACKVTARVFNQKSVSLVEIVCEGAWGKPGKKVLSTYLDILCHNFDDLSQDDIVKSIDWERRDSEGKEPRRVRTQAVALIRNIEAEMR